ncbi:MAG: hypothetical protein C0524_05965 [Rhodobacter sp.]|nr:hypothetical protein [Rhodobacter sp.]
MCNFAAIMAGLAVADAFIIAAIVATGIAIATNSSFFAAPTAVVPYGIAMVAAFAAAGSITVASSILAQPGCANAACAAEAAAARTAMELLTAAMWAATVLGIAAAALTPIPVAGAIALIAYTVGLAGVAIAMLPVTQTVAALERCVTAAANSTVTEVVIVVSAVVSLVGIAFLLVIIGSTRNGGDENDPFNPRPSGPNPD